MYCRKLLNRKTRHVNYDINYNKVLHIYVFMDVMQIEWVVPRHKYVDEALVCVEFGRNIVFDPLVDGLRGGVCFDLLQQFLLQFQQGEEETQTFPLKNLQHSVLILVNF